MQVASWWDYGYQTTAMANRTVIVDNNTWNNTHIATVGTAMASPRKSSMGDPKFLRCQICVCSLWRLIHFWFLETNNCLKQVLAYSLVPNTWQFFSGLIGYSSDDINKFLWMVRIGGGVFPHIKEADYLVSCGLAFCNSSFNCPVLYQIPEASHFLNILV